MSDRPEPTTDAAGKYHYRSIPETHGYFVDANGLLASDTLRTIGEIQYQHDSAMSTIRALLDHTAALTQQLAAARMLVANDAHAVTFQTMGQYRTALLKALAQSVGAA